MTLSDQAMSRDGLRGVAVLAWFAAGICLLPMLAVVLAALFGGTESVQHLAQTVLGRYTTTTLLLVVLEESGIMHRIAFVVDRGFHHLGATTQQPGHHHDKGKEVAAEHDDQRINRIKL